MVVIKIIVFGACGSRSCPFERLTCLFYCMYQLLAVGVASLWHPCICFVLVVLPLCGAHVGNVVVG